MADQSTLRSAADLLQNGVILNVDIETEKLISRGYVNEQYLQELKTEISTHRTFQVFLVADQAVKCFCKTDRILRREISVYEELYYEMESILGNEIQQLISSLGYPRMPQLDLDSHFQTLRELFLDLDYSMYYLEYYWPLLYEKMDKLEEVLLNTNMSLKALAASNKTEDSYHEPLPSAYNQNGHFVKALNSAHRPNNDYSDPVENINLRSEKVIRVSSDIHEVLGDFRSIMQEYYDLKCYILSVYHHN